MRLRNIWTLVFIMTPFVLFACGGSGGNNGIADTTSPTVPTGLLVTAANSNSVFLEWTASTDNIAVTGYKIYRDGNYLKSSATTTAADTGLNASTQYCYTISAYDAAGNESAKNSPACAKTWTISTIDSTGSVGVASSIARDSNDNLYISYYDGTNDAVKCISNVTGTWAVSTVDNNIGDVAGNISTAIAIDSADNVHISYGSYTRQKLMYAIVSAGTWTTSVIDTGIMRQTSMATDSNNKVHISYYDQSTGAFKYATNASGTWVITTIDTAGTSAGSSSIAVDSINKIHISYVGSYSSGPYYDLMYATNASGLWAKSVIEVGTTDSAAVVALVRDSNDKIHISYYDAINEDLKYATNASGAWITSTIDDTPYTGVVSSIAVDSNNNIHVAYNYFDVTGTDLKYATKMGDVWVTSILDSVGNMGLFYSITLDSNNKANISYWDGTFTNQDLKYATNR
jgi:Fibronectin type III domain